MNNPRADFPETIYPAQGVLAVLSRAWNLCKANLKETLLLILTPMVLLTAFSILLSIPASETFLTPVPLLTLAMKLLLGLVGMFLGLVAMVVWLFAACTLTRLYYSAIIAPKPLPTAECYRFVWKHKGSLLLLLVWNAVALTGFVMLDVIIVFVGILMSSAAFTALGSFAALSQNTTLAIMMILFLLLWGFVILSLLIGLMTSQGVLLMAPFIALSTHFSEHPLSWWRSIRQALGLLFANPPRLLIFTLALFLFSLVISLVLNGPVMMWFWFERARLGLSSQHALPVYMTTILSLGGSLANLVLMPFYISAVTLFWYDCQVRSEGLDLRLRLRQITGRQKSAID